MDVAIEQYEASFKAAEEEARQEQAAREEAQRLQDETKDLQWKSTEELADMLVQRVDDLIQLYEVVCKPNTPFFHKCGSTIRNIARQLQARELQVRLQARATKQLQARALSRQWQVRLQARATSSCRRLSVRSCRRRVLKVLPPQILFPRRLLPIPKNATVSGNIADIVSSENK